MIIAIYLIIENSYNKINAADVHFQGYAVITKWQKCM